MKKIRILLLSLVLTMLFGMHVSAGNVLEITLSRVTSQMNPAEWYDLGDFYVKPGDSVRMTFPVDEGVEGVTYRLLIVKKYKVNDGIDGVTSGWEFIYDESNRTIIAETTDPSLYMEIAKTGYYIPGAMGDLPGLVGRGCLEDDIAIFVENNFSVKAVGERERTVKTGESVSLSVSVTAEDTEGITYQWYKVVSGEKEAIAGANKAVYEIKEMTEDTVYWCMAVDKYDNYYSLEFRVNVEDSDSAGSGTGNQNTASASGSVSGSDAGSGTQTSPANTDTATSAGAASGTGTGKTDAQAASEAIAAATVPAEELISVPGGSGVQLQGVTAITNEAALAALPDLVTKVEAATSQGVQRVLNFDLNASGSGTVSIQVGQQYAGYIAIVGHYTNNAWTVQQVKVDANGYIAPRFASFSPISVILTNQTSAIAAIATTEAGVAASAPKTGDTTADLWPVVLLLLMIAAGTVLSGRRIKNR